VPRPMRSQGADETELPGFDVLYGLELTECSGELARGRVRVNDALRQAGGFVHGGVYAAIADALATRGTAAGAAGDEQTAIALASQTTVLHPIAGGILDATASRRHRGRTTWVWEVEIADEDRLVCVVGRVTVAVRAASQRAAADA
jgi:1,4-dihydroxy-2-naphthoyl-CoA hydrolase